MKRTHARYGELPAGFTLVELAAVIALVVVLILILLPMTPWQRGRDRASCAGNLKQMGLVFSLYASESPGNRLPPKSPYAIAPDVTTISPDYMTNFEPWVCPSSGPKDVLDKTNPDGWYREDGSPSIEVLRRDGASSYSYFGFAVPNNAWMEPVEAVRPLLKAAFENPDQNADWSSHPNSNVGDVTLYRIHSGVARLLAEEGHIHPAGPDGLSRLAVMWDHLVGGVTDGTVNYTEGLTPWKLYLNHSPGGSNVLFLDGHVEFVEYGDGRFPVTSAHAGVPTNNRVVIPIHEEK